MAGCDGCGEQRTARHTEEKEEQEDDALLKCVALVLFLAHSCGVAVSRERSPRRKVVELAVR